MATDLAKASPTQTIRGLLEKSKGQIAMALPRHMNADRLLRIAMTAIQRNPELLECTQVSLLGSIIEGAQLGVEPDGVRAHLVPRRNNKKGVKEAQLIVDYRGLMDLAARSGRVRICPPEVVYEKDKFSYSKGLHPSLTHEPFEGGDPGNVTHFYAVARYNDGFDPDFVVLTKADVDKNHRAKSPARDSGPWVTNYVDMGKKTGVRVLCKYVPSSPELSRAVELDEKAEQGIPQDIDLDLTLPADDAVITGTDGNANKEPGALDALGEKMKAANGNGEAHQSGESMPEQRGEAAQTTQQQTSQESKPADAGRARRRF